MISLLDRGRFFWPMWVWMGVLLLGSGSAMVNAQVATCFQGYQYFNNEEGQSPCQVFSNLMTACLSPTAPFPVPELSDSSYSIPSGGANPCACNTVTYSMMSACSVCQNEAQVLPSYTTWSQSCNAAQVNNGNLRFPANIPSGTSIPSWAFNSLDVNNNFVFALAETHTASDSFPVTSSSTTNNRFADPSASSTSMSAHPEQTPQTFINRTISTTSTSPSVQPQLPSQTANGTAITTGSSTTTIPSNPEQTNSTTVAPQPSPNPTVPITSTTQTTGNSHSTTAAATAALGKSHEPLGIVLGVVGALFVLVLVLIGYMMLRRRARRRAASAEMVEVPRDNNPFNRSIESFTSMSPLRNNFVGNDGDDTRTISTGASGAPLLRRIQAVSTRWSSLLNRQTRAMSRAASLSIAGASRGSLVKTRPTPPEPLPEPDEVYIRRVHEKIDTLHAQHAEIRAAIRPPSGEMRLAAQSHLLGPDFISPIRTSSVVANASATERHRESTYSDGGSSGWETTSVGSATWPSHAFVR
ncbi:hypothetical protein SCHPADRAFT_504622 [Schizopora paradoxa]|uniref:Mid2 domain-containing protein n=1 Tax=Schizopora paradoxa TaxID=27342 RepID=A0A0H2RMR9_9AGAM|nr:hypothetical protein SCHPADRAFT_504622 [Schizopora paradoxa]